MEELLRKIGFKNIQHYKSSTEIIESVSVATINILRDNLDTPVLILEDDIEWTGISDFDYNPNTDAVYLGISKCGGHPILNIDLGQSQFSQWSDTQSRVQNMLSAHAVLYISKRYKEAVISTLENHKNQKYYSDVLFSRLHKHFLILAQNKPIFYQSTKFNPDGHVENCTLFELVWTCQFK